MTHGELDTASFVQVMEGHCANRDRAIELEHEVDPVLARSRPELLGAVTAYFGDDEFAEIAYFTSESAARTGERQEMPEDMASKYAEWEHVMKVDRFIDLPQPWLMSARA